MDESELRRRLKPILDAEERGDWDRVNQLSDQLNRELLGQRCPEIVDHYLDDADVRAEDDRYAETQRQEVRRFVATGEHTEGTPIPLWSCGLFAAVVIVLIIWLLN